MLDMLDFAKKMAVDAGEILAKEYGHRTRVAYKDDFNPTIKLDDSIEKKIFHAIREKYPEHEIIGEEGNNYRGKSDYTWVIDPLDGTVNFIRGFPYFSVAISVLKKNEPFVGVVYHPVTKELFYAQQGEGAFLNGKKIRVSKINSLAEAYLSTGFRYNRGKGFSRSVEKFKSVLEKALVVRRTGSAALDLCQVAKGTFDGFFMYDSRKWDVIAGLLIIQEAGGEYSLIPKENYFVDVIAANPAITAELKDLLEWK